MSPEGSKGSAAPQPVTGDGRRFERHAFVCTSDSSCGKAGGGQIQERLKSHLKASGLKESLRINKAGCLGQCGHGPMMVVYPEGIWYSHLDTAGADRVWKEHMLAGKPVEELRYTTIAPGTNVVNGPDGLLRERPEDKGPLSSPCERCPE